MTNPNATARIEAEDPAAVKRRLVRRMILAGFLIVVLLGALAAFDRLSKLDEEVLPVKNGPGVGPSLRTPGQPQSLPALPTVSAAAVSPAAASPAVASAPAVLAVPVPPPPEITAQPKLTPAPAAPVAAAAPAAKTPAVAAPAKAPAKAPAAVPEGTAAPTTPLMPQPVQPTQPVRQAPLPPVLPQLTRGYVLQAGVFTSAARAEELRERLQKAGVPVTIEARVQVGPFASQKEADAARAKMREMGIDAMLIPPKKR